MGENGGWLIVDEGKDECGGEGEEESLRCVPEPFEIFRSGVALIDERRLGEGEPSSPESSIRFRSQGCDHSEAGRMIFAAVVVARICTVMCPSPPTPTPITTTVEPRTCFGNDRRIA